MTGMTGCGWYDRLAGTVAVVGIVLWLELLTVTGMTGCGGMFDRSGVTGCDWND